MRTSRRAVRARTWDGDSTRAAIQSTAHAAEKSSALRRYYAGMRPLSDLRAMSLVLLLAAPFAGCGGTTPNAARPINPELSRASFDDSTRAIETYIAANRTREAELIARKLVENATGDERFARGADEYAARAYFARAELAKSELAPAERDALVREAAHAAARAAIPPATPDAMRFAAMLADRVGAHADAQALYARALEANPDDPATLLPAAISANSFDPASGRATDYAERHARFAPDDAWTPALFAEIALARGQHDAAVQHAERAIACDRDRVEFRLVLAKSLRAAGRARDAARLLSALDAAERVKPAIVQQLALALTEVGEFAAALTAWESAVRVQPDDAYLRAEFALACLRAGETDRASAALTALDALFGGAAQRTRIDPTIRTLRGAQGSAQ